MNRILIVDDETAFLQSLRVGMGAFASLDVMTARNGGEAVALLEEPGGVDLVLTDLRMPEMDGFELLAYMSRRFPRTPALVMTAFATPAILEQLSKYGGIPCLEKPVDLDALAARIFEQLTKRDRDRIRGISIASFLQLVQMENKSCDVDVIHGGAQGQLAFRSGELLHAQYGDLSGDEATLEMVTWDDVVIEMRSADEPVEPNVQSSLSFLLVESLRLKDEARRDSQEPLEEPPEGSIEGAPRLIRPPAPERSAGQTPAPARSSAPAPSIHRSDESKTQFAGVIPKETIMSMEEHLQSLREIRGYLASAFMSYTGEVLATDSVTDDINLDLVGATFNDVFRSGHEAAIRIGLEANRETVIKTPKGVIVMQCSGVDAPVHLHFVAVMTIDGNQALMKLRLDAMLPKVVAELMG